MNNMEIWLSIFEYSKNTGKSISTIRRYIKSGKLQTKMVEGKYYIISTQKEYSANQESEEKHLEKINFLQRQLEVAREEINELRMLVDLYEKKDLPQIPSLVSEEVLSNNHIN